MAGYFHVPIMTKEVIAFLQPQPGGLYCDATLGGGGHSEAILEASSPDGHVLGIDRDPAAIAAAQTRLARFGRRFTAVQGNFGALTQILSDRRIEKVDGFFADLGVSSPQLDHGERGFSFQRRGPIDMRMNPHDEKTALDFIEQLDQRDLAWILKQYGDEKFSNQVARALKKAAEEKTLTNTIALAEVVRSAIRLHDAGQDPATRTFQALRIAVNDELGQLQSLLQQLPDCLAPQGRAVFLCFHSLEERMLKQAWKPTAGLSNWVPLTNKAVSAGPDETAANPRSRSARLRAAMYTNGKGTSTP